MYSISNSGSFTGRKGCEPYKLSGAGGGFDNSYWSKNKGSSKQEILKKITAVLTVLFFVLALLLDSKLFN